MYSKCVLYLLILWCVVMAIMGFVNGHCIVSLLLIAFMGFYVYLLFGGKIFRQDK
jgi:hypothetical protein